MLGLLFMWLAGTGGVLAQEDVESVESLPGSSDTAYTLGFAGAAAGKPGSKSGGLAPSAATLSAVAEVEGGSA